MNGKLIKICCLFLNPPKKLVLIFLLFSFYTTVSANFSKDSLSIKIDEYIKKAGNYESLLPDSSIYYYRKALGLLDESDIKNSELTRTKILRSLGYIFHQKNRYSFATDFYKRSLESAIASGNDSLMAESYFSVGEISLENGSYEEALNSYAEAIRLFEEIDYDEGVFWTHIGMGIVLRESGNTGLSKEHYEKAREIGIEKDDNFLIGVSNNNIGNLYNQIGEYQNAIKYLRLALGSFEKYGEERFISDCLESIGDVYAEMGNYTLAISYYKRSTKIAESLADQYRLFSRYANLAKSYDALGKNEEALVYFSKTLELAQATGDKARMSDILIMISDFYRNNNNFESALKFNKRSLAISRETGDTVSIASAYISLSKLYYFAGRLEKAKSAAENAFEISKSKDLLKIHSEAAYYLSKISADRNDFQNAYNYYNIYSALQDSLLNTEKIKILAEAEAKYNLENLEKDKSRIESEAVSAEKQINNQYIIIAMMSGLMLLGIFFLGRTIVTKRRAKNDEREKARQLNKKIDLLSSQLDEKNRELTSKAVMISSNNRVLEEVVESIEDYLNNQNSDKKELRKLKNRLQNIYEKESWENFLQHFNDVHPGFYKKLSDIYSDLTLNEQKICAFLRMNLNTKEISNITGQSIKGIEVARTRIRKKLGIDHQESLTNAIRNI